MQILALKNCPQLWLSRPVILTTILQPRKMSRQRFLTVLRSGHHFKNCLESELLAKWPHIARSLGWCDTWLITQQFSRLVRRLITQIVKKVLMTNSYNLNAKSCFNWTLKIMKSSIKAMIAQSSRPTSIFWGASTSRRLQSAITISSRAMKR